VKKYFFIFILLLQLHGLAQPFTTEEITRWKEQAKRVTIIRDNWGIPHIYGKEDADAVFGLLYAQCEDDFNRVEMNFVSILGRLAEIKGENELTSDLMTRLLIDTADAKGDYAAAPDWLKKLLNAHADGINYYLYTHPTVKPLLLKRFEPWFHLLWTDGSISAINTADVTEADVTALYLPEKGYGAVHTITNEEKLTGSNGFAFSPSITKSHNAILYINPHVTFYFRPEVHMVSEEGLNAYGAVTWGQLFIYQGFNEHCGWMHTSSYTDIADTYMEKTTQTEDGKRAYEYDGQQLPLEQKKIVLRYRKGNQLKERYVNTWYTVHGPVMTHRNGQFISLKSNNRSMNSLVQSWKRTKANSFADYKASMALLANTSNNTVYADAEGNIAYWHGNFIPVRDTHYDWSKPVDGSIKETDWKGLHSVDESVHLYNPENGWIQNCNSTPFTAAGHSSPDKNKYPRYMAPDGENFRGITAVKVLGAQKEYTLESVITAGYSTYLSAFEVMIPVLVKHFQDEIKENDSLYAVLKDPIAVLQKWDFHCSENSVATTLAVEWADRISPSIWGIRTADEYGLDIVEKTKTYLETAPERELINTFAKTIQDLKARFGTWNVAWGEINRYQRLSGDFDLRYDDRKKSIPVAFASSAYGMLPSFVSQPFPGTRKRYGYKGNSFICAVEFGKRIQAKTLLTGGESGAPSSRHFSDQSEMYCKGQFKDVLIYKEDVLKHAEKIYHPGQK
jgi:acyl-homoserine lactone acylase PvdQ